MRTLSGYLKRRRGKLIDRWGPVWNRVRVAQRWKSRPATRPHQRDRALVVSLTSYPARFATLHLTLRSLLTQTVSPDRVMLWIAADDVQQLPQSVRELEPHGLEVRACADLLSYKKIIPCLEAFPSADIVTADDDVFYWPNWLEELLLASAAHPRDVIAHRVHRMSIGPGGIMPYREWDLSLNDASAHPLNFATGIGGVLYPAGCFHTDVACSERFMQLCPSADDVWLYWMVRMNGRFERHSGTRHTPRPWRGSQKSSLWKFNKRANDEQIRAMFEEYGLPWGQM